MSELVLEPAVRQLEMLRAREISVVELAEAHITQIERLNPQLNAFADFDAERVREQARAMDMRTCQCARAAAWAAGDGEVVDRDGGIQVRDREPEPQGRDSARGCGCGGAAARCRCADSGHDELSRVPDGLRDGRICCMGGRGIRGTWSARRADRAEASRRRLRRACRRRGWVPTAEGRCGCLRTLQGSVR